MKKSILKAIPVLIISGSILFAQYYDPYNYQNNNSYQNNNYQNNNEYQNNNYQNTASYDNYYNYYQEFMNVLAREASNPNSIYYSPVFSKQYNNYGQMNSDPYQEAMNAMSAASSYYNQNYYDQNYNNSYNYNGSYNNDSYGYSYDSYVPPVNPYEELMKMLEIESKNPNSPYYSPYNNNAAQNNNYYNEPNQYNYSQANTQNPYEAAAEELIKEAEELSKNNNQSANNNTESMQNSQNNNYQNFYTPFKVPKEVFNTANRIYPNVQIIDVEMEKIGIYEVRLSNMMRLFIDRNGELLYEKTDY